MCNTMYQDRIYGAADRTGAEVRAALESINWRQHGMWYSPDDMLFDLGRGTAQVVNLKEGPNSQVTLSVIYSGSAAQKRGDMRPLEEMLPTLLQ